jgi:SAM-dependent methyltransferase
VNEGRVPPGRDYSSVTEVPGVRVTAEALSMARSRYAFASERCADKDVLEIACGAGPGLGPVRAAARRLVGSDYTFSLLARARQHYGGRIPFVRLDAQALPFVDASFDAALLFEAIYYLPDAALFFRECRRILRRDGQIIVCTINCEWVDFNPSPFSTRYLSAAALRTALESAEFDVDLYGGFSAMRGTGLSTAVSWIKRAAIGFGLMPRTMKSKEWLKRLFFGPLVGVPAEFPHDGAPYDRPVPIDGENPASHFKVIYAVARVR